MKVFLVATLVGIASLVSAQDLSDLFGAPEDGNTLIDDFEIFVQGYSDDTCATESGSPIAVVDDEDDEDATEKGCSAVEGGTGSARFVCEVETEVAWIGSYLTDDCSGDAAFWVPLSSEEACMAEPNPDAPYEYFRIICGTSAAMFTAPLMSVLLLSLQ